MESNNSNPYKEFSYTIPAGGQVTIYYQHKYFRVLTLASGSDVRLRFGAQGSETSLIGAGIGTEHDEPIRDVVIRNAGAGSVTILVALSMGRITDDRLNVSGTVTVQVNGSSVFDSKADVAVTTATATSVLAANTSRKEAIITNLIANGGAVRIGDSGVSATNGLELPAGGVFIYDGTAELFVYQASGGSYNIAVVETT